MRTATHTTKRATPHAAKARKTHKTARASARLSMKPIRKLNKKVVSYVSHHKTKSAGLATLMTVLIASAVFLKMRFLK